MAFTHPTPEGEARIELPARTVLVAAGTCTINASQAGATRATACSHNRRKALVKQTGFQLPFPVYPYLCPFTGENSR